MDQTSFFQGLLDGKCAIDTVSRFDASEYTCQIAAQVSDALSQLKVDVALWANFDSHDLSPVASVELLVPLYMHVSEVADDFDAASYFTNKKSARSNDRFTHFGGRRDDGP
jgi:hypothetical protein